MKENKCFYKCEFDWVRVQEEMACHKIGVSDKWSLVKSLTIETCAAVLVLTSVLIGAYGLIAPEEILYVFGTFEFALVFAGICIFGGVGTVLLLDKAYGDAIVIDREYSRVKDGRLYGKKEEKRSLEVGSKYSSKIKALYAFGFCRILDVRLKGRDVIYSFVDSNGMYDTGIVDCISITEKTDSGEDNAELTVTMDGISIVGKINKSTIFLPNVGVPFMHCTTKYTSGAI